MAGEYHEAFKKRNPGLTPPSEGHKPKNKRAAAAVHRATGRRYRHRHARRGVATNIGSARRCAGDAGVRDLLTDGIGGVHERGDVQCRRGTR